MFLQGVGEHNGIVNCGLLSACALTRECRKSVSGARKLRLHTANLPNSYGPLPLDPEGGGAQNAPSSIGRAPFMRYVHKGCSQVRLTAHIVHEWINVSEVSRISIFQSWQL